MQKLTASQTTVLKDNLININVILVANVWVKLDMRKNQIQIHSCMANYSATEAPNLKKGFFFLGSTSGLYTDWLTRCQYVINFIWQRTKCEWEKVKCAFLAWLGSMNCLLERSYYVQTHTPAAVETWQFEARTWKQQLDTQKWETECWQQSHKFTLQQHHMCRLYWTVQHECELKDVLHSLSLYYSMRYK